MDLSPFSCDTSPRNGARMKTYQLIKIWDIAQSASFFFFFLHLKGGGEEQEEKKISWRILYFPFTGGARSVKKTKKKLFCKRNFKSKNRKNNKILQDFERNERKTLLKRRFLWFHQWGLQWTLFSRLSVDWESLKNFENLMASQKLTRF